MPSAAYGAGGISTNTAGWMIKTALEHAAPVLILQKYCKVFPLPKNSTKTINMRRPNSFPLVTTPLTEGVAPSAEALSYTPIDMTLQQYGRVFELTDQVEDMAKEPVLEDMSIMGGEAFALTYEMLTFYAARGGTQVVFNNGTARNQVNTAITAASLRNAVRTLKRNKARFIGKKMGGSPNFKTEPVGEAYYAFCHTDVEADLRQNLGSAFVPVELYGAGMGAEPYEIGKFENVRFICTPEFGPWVDAGGAKGVMKSTGGTSADVYPMLIMGREAVGCVALKGANALTPYVLQPGQARGGDPLGQKGSVGFKGYHVAGILNDAWIVRIEVATVA